MKEILKNWLLKGYNWPYVPIAIRDQRQEFVRDFEWNSIKPFIKPGNFLDVGCGAGYAMKRAQTDFNCVTSGIDPEPGAHGVGRLGNNYMDSLNIVKGFSENLPYANGTFDTVYSSHVLEHVNNVSQTLKEMNRVLKDDGVLIIGMPTATMAFLNGVTRYILTTHHRIINFFFSNVITTGKGTFKEIFLPPSHSHPGRSFIFDMGYYKVTNWKKMLESEFTVNQTLLPLLYCYPEFRQFFKPIKTNGFSSSVIFVCSKKINN
jgi:SAM-dependent methyltransferase